MAQVLDIRIEYDVTNPSNVYEITVIYTILLFTYGGLILEIMCLIFFICHFWKKTPAFCTNYFYLLVLGYIVNIFSIIVSSVGVYTYDVDFISNLTELTRWYLALFLG